MGKFIIKLFILRQEHEDKVSFCIRKIFFRRKISQYIRAVYKRGCIFVFNKIIATIYSHSFNQSRHKYWKSILPRKKGKTSTNNVVNRWINGEKVAKHINKLNLGSCNAGVKWSKSSSLEYFCHCTHFRCLCYLCQPSPPIASSLTTSCFSTNSRTHDILKKIWIFKIWNQSPTNLMWDIPISFLCYDKYI